ncbi:CLOCK-interacting pacemaker isoform X1 [Neophocaena asiaeorientalis asiaeorientalis]|uniref:CLOCK-interacting pacemaker isoform X1 n=1 Tax=Neophocaena asiaeorientalis asiaeorientalis TaxID=1706337 RepID=A0A341AVM7_NEOAA|nr:CLOCK-interacting pacemaker isoform X1 [Neophocaena asiaeorientalis asiaeorientalis]XP_024593654.1 CLOCK-interacting pacemaker isoform X1 [Neophocaena asiaeorientalis asiaeorientalis]XP_024593656.1 CLOCK-interacting pacemaker isoform X1 [Neophocaena asiaeorientalis asiaeorientalis]XP_024593657.1 CLOCK-interacting pacemaker isoform X1 [Neophocaena asiaeorientalis asiaeorientalis]
MERKNPSREGSRRLSAKLSKGPEMKKVSRQLGMAAAESDKDSGFSDGSSECLSSAEQMESEDMLSTLGWSREDRPRPSAKPASGAFPTLAPMVVMKNVLVKQGSSSSQLQSWSVQPSFEVISAQPQLLFLHPPVPSPVSPCHAGEKKSDSRNYLPILNSYTKIAPHPGKRGLSLSPEERGEGGMQKKICTERLGPSLSSSEPTKTGAGPPGPLTPAPPSTKLAEDSALQGVPCLVAGGSPQTLQPVSSSHVAKAPSLTFASPASPVCASDSTLHGMESNSPLSPLSASYSSPLWAAEHLCRSPDSFSEQRQSKHRRFQNTLVVLHKSGLLEITLKTKELIRQNQATQVELDQLKEQTRLFIEAAKSRAPQAWAKLQASLTSGSGHPGSDLEAFSDQPDI